MRVVTDTALQIIASETRGVTWVADLYYNGERRAKDVPVADVSLDWDAGRQVAGSGSLSVVWADDFGKDLSPRDVSDWFAPFGAELQVDAIVSAGRFSERIPMGRFIIASVPRTETRKTKLPTVSTVIPVELRDVLHRVGRNKFAFPTSPSSTSVWTEAQALTSLPVVRNVTDATVPATALFEGSRLDTLDDLFSLMQAWPQLSPQGVLTARPFTWPVTSSVVTSATVVTSELKSENVYNRVVVEGKGPNDTVVRAIADAVDGPLRVRNFDGTPSPYGVVPYFYSSEFITTQDQAEAVAKSTLSRVSRIRGVFRKFTEPFQPQREIGDVLTLNGELVRITQVAFSDGMTDITAEVAE